jgi:MoaA/NifB/PqqE/SkfB family radical SAM enzyme/SAM-dependent methyltransferase
MSFEPSAWERFEFEGTPVYLRDSSPCWFVPDDRGDRIIRTLQSGIDPGNVTARQFIHRLPSGTRSTYPGRSALLDDNTLRELWIHVTNNCNLNCRHCLCNSGPGQSQQLGATELLKLVDSAAELGCRVFALTGGEPMVHPAFVETVDRILSHPDTHAVVLTNGTLLDKMESHIRRWGSERFHLQISLDGNRESHDAIRGKGAFDRLHDQTRVLRKLRFPFTVSMSVQAGNAPQMPQVAETAARFGASNLHFMWYFVSGRGASSGFAAPDRIFANLRLAAEKAETLGMSVDNIEAMKTQVFAPPGTIHDGTTAGLESAAVGPDGRLYPSAAFVGVEALATDISSSLAEAWNSSPVLNEIRNQTAAALEDPFRFITGGGDIDHSYMASGKFTGNDPYLPLYRKIILWLISRETAAQKTHRSPGLRLKMGDILESCGAHGGVALVHSNCLLSVADENSRAAVKDFYSEAASDTKEDILNPLCYEEEFISHIPEEFRFRGYGCGSPVTDAGIKPGENVVDLGSGRGIECFIAARLVGSSGFVTGIDMLEPMLELAGKALAPVAGNLGFLNIDFRKGYLEELPVPSDSADLVLSNCVLNLSTNKRSTFSEMYRILKADGRIVISDVVCEEEPPPEIKNDDTLKGECIAGAMTQKDLFGILAESGFHAPAVIRRFPYRTVGGHRFFSMTYSAYKKAPRPATGARGTDAGTGNGSHVFRDPVRVLYRGPFESVKSPGGTTLFAGRTFTVERNDAEKMGDSVFILDENGSATNVELENTCACATAPENGSPDNCNSGGRDEQHRKFTCGCMVCGAPLEYLRSEEQKECAYCRQALNANSVCANGHFVCDQCHSKDAIGVIERICTTTSETDMLTLMEQIREHPSVPVHGPEHHGLVPGIVLATYRNLGGNIAPELISRGIQRGMTIPGGGCGFAGVEGAAAGVGIAFSLILGATPLTADPRKSALTANHIITREIADIAAPRCCQREIWVALKKTAELSREMLPVTLKADKAVKCVQQKENNECIGRACPLMCSTQQPRATAASSSCKTSLT